MKILQIVGRKKVGKTTFVTRLIPLLTERGLRVATVKHTRNPYPLDREGTDSFRHRAAGAEATLVLTASGSALHFDPPADSGATERLIARLLGEFDLVLLEGWRDRGGPRIEVVAVTPDGAPDLLDHPDPDDLLALVLGPRAPGEWAGGGRGGGGWPDVPVFGWEAVEAVGELVREWVRGTIPG